MVQFTGATCSQNSWKDRGLSDSVLYTIRSASGDILSLTGDVPVKKMGSEVVSTHLVKFTPRMGKPTWNG